MQWHGVGTTHKHLEREKVNKMLGSCQLYIKNMLDQSDNAPSALVVPTSAYRTKTLNLYLSKLCATWFLRTVIGSQWWGATEVTPAAGVLIWDNYNFYMGISVVNQIYVPRYTFF